MRFNPSCSNCCGSTACSGSILFSIVPSCQSGGPSEGFATPTVTATGPTGASVPVYGRHAINLATQGSGSYTITITYPGYYNQVLTVTGTCGSNTLIGTIYLYPTTLTFTVGSLCGGLNGSTLQLSGAYSNTYTFSGNTGYQYPETITIDVADLDGYGPPPDYTATLSQPRYEDVVHVYSFGAATAGSSNWSCTNTLTLGTLSDCYQCCVYGDAFANQFPTTNNFLLTTPMGSVVISTDLTTTDQAFTVSAHPEVDCPPPDLYPGCGCLDPLTSTSVLFSFECYCAYEEQEYLPAIFISYVACPDGYGSGVVANGYSQEIQINWTSLDSIVPLALTGNIAEYDSSTSIYPYYYVAGDYTLSEIPCDYFGGGGGTGTGGVSMMSLDASDHSDPNPFPQVETDKVRVGFVAPCLVMGGAEHHTLSLVKSLDPSRFSVQGVAVLGNHVSQDMVSMFPCVVSNASHAAEHLLRQCDLVISWAFLDLTTLEHKPKIVYVNHLPKKWTYTESRSLANVDHVVAVSDLARETIACEFRPRTSVIWNAVDGERMAIKRDRDEVRRQWKVGSDHYVIGYLGRLEAEKDPDALIRMAWELPSHFKVVIVGDGSMMSTLRASAPPNVIFAGNSSDAGSVLNAFDHLVLPSRYESFGLTLAEAWWQGLPVISTSVGLATMVGGLTRLVPIDADGATLARAVMSDLEDLDGTMSRVEAAMEFAWRQLGIERFGQQWGDLLLDVLG